MTIKLITSRNNALLKDIRLVSSGSRRAQSDMVVAEGVRVLQEATKSNAHIDAVVIAEDFGASREEKNLLQAWQQKNVSIHRTAAEIFKSISDVKSPQGAVALVRLEPGSMDDALSCAPNPLILYACGIQDPGNLGTLMRTAAAAGASMVCTSPGTVSPRNPKTVRASAGTCFRLRIAEQVEAAAFLRQCRRHDIRVYRTDVREGVSHLEADFRIPCAIVVGNEGQGIPESQWIGCRNVHIPMAEGVESLNVAMAGTIILFEAVRQRAKA